MKKTKPSLSKKILFLLPLTLVLTLTPILFISMNRTTRDIEMLYQEGVKDIFKIYDISVKNSVQIQELVKQLIQNIPEARMDMIGQAFFDDLNTLMDAKPSAHEITTFLEEFGNRTKTHNIVFQMVKGELTPLYAPKNDDTHPQLTHIRSEDGEGIYDILKSIDKTGKGDIVFIPKNTAANTPPYLFHIFPFHEENLYLFSFFDINTLTHNLATIDSDIRGRMTNFATSMDFLDDGFTISYDRTSKAVVNSSSNILLPPDVAFNIPLDKTEGTRHTIDNGDVYILFTHASKDDNFLILTAIAQKTVDDIVSNMMFAQILACIGIFIVGCLFASVLARRLLAPMQDFTQLIRRFSAQDVTKPDPTFLTALPLHRDDEVGDMARAFANMTRLLQKNIKELVDMTAKQSRLDGELLAARQSQEGFLPAPWPNTDKAPFHIDALLLPAREIGGDLYDYFMLDDEHLCLCIGDVSGKGMPAALVMGATTMLIRTAMPLHRTPAKTLHFVNNQLCNNNAQQMFVSLFLGVYCLTDKTLTFSLAGHPAPIVWHPTNDQDEQNEQNDQADKGAAPIPVSAPDLVAGLMPDIPYHTHTYTLPAGSRLLLFTDGITEAQNIHDTFYGDPQLVQFCTNHKDCSNFLQALLKNVQEFTQGNEQNDDITALLLSTKTL